MKREILLAATILVSAACSSGTPASNQPRANVESGVRVDISATSDDGTVLNPSHALQPAREKLGRCYKDALATRPGIAGSMAFSQVVDSDGRPGRTDLTPDATLADGAFQSCIQHALDGVRFAGPIAKTATIHGSIVFGAP